MSRKKTHEEFINDFTKLYPDGEYEVRGEYVNNKTPIEVFHIKCGRSFKAKPNNLLSNKSRCPHCYKENKGLYIMVGFKEAKKMLYEAVGDEYSFVEYNGMCSKAKFRHNSCGYVFEMKPTNLIHNGQRCTNPDCLYERTWKNHPMKKTHYEFVKEVDEKFKGIYKVVGEYKNTDTMIEILHLECGRIFTTLPETLLRGTSNCTHCVREKLSKDRRKGTKKFIEEVNKLYPNEEYVVVGEYINNKTKIEILHTVCGKIFKVEPNAFINYGHGCSHCAKNKKKDTEWFKEKVFELEGDNYEVVGDYINSLTKIIMKHKKCGKTFKIRPNDFINGRRCPHCSKSKGEKKIAKYLDENNIKNKEQFTFKDLKGIKGRVLKFDFAILDNDDNVRVVIEYQGEQHYRPVSFGGNAEKNFTNVVFHDALKNSYCMDNNIPILYIPFREFNNIELILNDYLNKLINLNNVS